MTSSIQQIYIDIYIHVETALANVVHWRFASSHPPRLVGIASILNACLSVEARSLSTVSYYTDAKLG